MKTRITYIVLTLFMVSSIQGQIKIGDNPQNLDPSSVLELESSSRVLVITRMTTTQMESTSPLRGAMVYNIDTQCIHFYTGTLWENLCNRPDEQTFTTDAIVNFSPSIVITQDGNNYNFEVGEIRGENIVDTSINGQLDIQPGSITGQQLQDASISFDKLAFGDNTGEILQWNGAEWTLVNASGLAITEVDGVIGNEVVGPFDTTLTLEGTGDGADPFRLDVSVGGIGTNEIANNAVRADKINADVAGIGLIQAVDGSLEVDVTDFSGDGDISSTDGTIAITGTTTNALFEDISLDVADDAINADKINADVAGIGLIQAVDGSLEVDVTDFSGDGDISSTDGTIAITGTTTNALFEDISLDVADDAITLAKIADGDAGVPDQVMQWDGTDWTLEDGSALTQVISGTIGSIFFSDGAGSLLENNTNLFWDDSFASGTGALGVGTNTPQAKLHVKEVGGNNLSYGLQIQNEDGTNSGGSASGILFSVESLGNYGKGALAYERNNNFGRGDFHFLQNSAENNGLPGLADAVMTLKNDGKVGVGTTVPNSTLETAGSFAASIVTTIGNITLGEANYTVILNGNHSITLPPANTCQGRIYIIKNTTGFNPTISSYFDSIGAATTTISNGVIQLQSDGTNWQQIN
ncbi:MAG: hypothetical protein ABJO12_03655 [Flavobacteriaceae bacterium]